MRIGPQVQPSCTPHPVPSWPAGPWHHHLRFWVPEKCLRASGWVQGVLGGRQGESVGGGLGVAWRPLELIPGA